ncbi:hypothetical protein SAY87_009224 [Trapa incisa]|uniref:DUF7866 domain-containing protein n=2 Tax=Trapa TaxID=22665 RepID=A0AAN7MSJ8_TRANT|nr:hypothetical protein SAY87_009224 [Trapa incisa]KAK4798293.1 hypothetical protein SAY86_030619 [Trapa natans]
MAAADQALNLVAFLSVIIIIELITANHVNWMPADRQASNQPANFPIPKTGWSGGPRRQLAPFQLCLPCKCCSAASPAPICASMPCCFEIDCQIPNKPFGFCAFVPMTCNCTSCAV